MQNRPRRRQNRRLRLQQLQQRCLLAGDLGHNFVEAEDVNLDGRVTPEDVAQILTRISQRLNRYAIGAPDLSSDRATVLLDVDDNGLLTSGDALRIINQLGEPAGGVEALEEGVRDLAAAILSQSLPEAMRLGTALTWLGNLEDRLGIPSADRGPLQRLDADQSGDLSENEVDQALWAVLSEADADGSNSLTHDEIKQARPAETTVQIPSDLAAAALDQLDVNENGALF